MARKLIGLFAAMGMFMLSANVAPGQSATGNGLERLAPVASGSTATPLSLKLRPPSRGIYHSAFPAFGPEEDTVTARHITQFSRNISGKDLTWAYFSDNWFNGITFPTRDVKTILAKGVIPFIRIMPRSTWKACSDRKYSLDKIIKGRFDDKLRRYARDAAKIRAPMIMEFGTEVNGDWFPWSGACNGAGNRTGYGSPRLADGPERFRDAYRHLIDIFRAEGAHNVTWVIHYNGGGAPQAGWNKHAAYYPGDEYIDWIGLSAYGAQTPAVMRQWNPQFREVMDVAYRNVALVSRNKPIALLEFGVIEHKGKPEWIRNAFRDLASGRYRRLKAISWWHSDWRNADGSWSRMKIDSSPEAATAYRNGVAHSMFVTKAVISR